MITYILVLYQGQTLLGYNNHCRLNATIIKKSGTKAISVTKKGISDKK
jgi:hypothetical protein